MATNVFGYIEVATSNGSRFSNAQDGDFLIYTDSNSQSICFGSHDGANAALRISSNVTTCFGYFANSNGYVTNGLNMNLVKTASPSNIVSSNFISPWASTNFAFNFSSNIASFAFSSTASNTLVSFTSNTQLLASSNDTVSLPSYTFQGNSNTGMYHASNNQIAFTAGGSNTLTVSQAGIALSSNISACNLTGFKNRIINGDFRIDQRIKGAMVAVPFNSLTYSVDRFTTYIYGNHLMSAGQSTLVTPPAGFQYAYRATITTASTTINTDYNTSVFQTTLEGNMMNDFIYGTAAAQPGVLSFWAYCSISTSFAIYIRNANSTRSYISPFSCTANTWAYITIPVAGDTIGTYPTGSNGTINLGISTAVGATYSSGTSNTWLAGNYVGITGQTNGFISTAGNNLYIAGLQFEKGRLATPFEYRPFHAELLLCQRYYFRRYNDSLYDKIGLWNADASTSGFSFIPFPTRMRAIPSAFTISSTSHFAFGGVTVTAIARDANSTSAEAGIINIQGSGFTALKVYPIFTNNQAAGTAWIAFDAEM